MSNNNFNDYIYGNAFQDIKNYVPKRDDAVLDGSVLWPATLPSMEARNIVNRFYALRGEGGQPGRERFTARNVPLGVDVTCQLQRYQCNSVKANGQRCTRGVVAGIPLCFQHSLSTFGVKISKTSLVDSSGQRINMLGLFACKKTAPAFQQNQVICPYIGEIRTHDELESMYPGDASATYTLVMGGDTRRDTQRVDSACMRGIGAYVNTAPSDLHVSPAEMERISESGSSIMKSQNGGQPVRAVSNCEILLLVTNVVYQRVKGRRTKVAKNPQPWIVSTRQIASGEEIFAPILSYNHAGPHDHSSTRGQNLKRATCRYI